MQFTAGLAQVTATSGDVAGNLQIHLEMIESAKAAGVDLLIFPELSLSGANLQEHMPAAARAVSDREFISLTRAAARMDLVVGFAEDAGGGAYYNSLVYISGGTPQHVHRKVYLVSADPLNERRFFAEGQSVRAFPTRFGPAAILNCEDAWHLGPAYLAMLGGAEILITAAATPGGPPTQLPSEELWLTLNRAYSIVLEVYNLFVNRVGSEGEIEFCGSSHAVGPRGELLVSAPKDRPCVTAVGLDTEEVRRQRYEVSYVRDDRAALTLRELQRIVEGRSA